MIFSLAELAAHTAAQLIGDPKTVVQGVNTLDEATQSDVSFLANPRYVQALKQSAAGVICVAPGISLPEGRNYLISENPSRTFQTIAELLIPPGKSGFSGIHPTAILHETVQIGERVTIGPYATLDRNVKIGAGTVIGSHVFIGYEVEIGSNCLLHPSSIVRERCKIGNRVILQPGVVIGSCGFGFISDAVGRHQTLEQLGIVILEDDV